MFVIMVGVVTSDDKSNSDSNINTNPENQASKVQTQRVQQHIWNSTRSVLRRIFRFSLYVNYIACWTKI